MPPPLLKCIFCHSMMIIPDMPPINYIDHLEKHHQIIYEMDFVINRTLLEQHPNLIKETVSSEGEEEDEPIDASVFLKQSHGIIDSEYDTSLLTIKEEILDLENRSMDEELVFGDDEDIEMEDLHLKDAEISEDTEKNEDISQDTEESINDDLNNFIDNIETTLDEIDSKKDVVLLEETMDVSGFGEHFLNEQTSSEPKMPWYHGCLYSCQLCTKQFIQKESFKQHIETTHSLVFDKYEKTENGEKSYIKNTHECEQCGKGVSWYKSAIEKHLASQHNTTLEEYYKEFKNDIELPEFEITDPSLLSRFGVESTDKKDEDGMSSTSTDLSWANKCVYKCNICGINLNSRYDFEKHMPSVHKISVGEYTKDHGKGIIHQEKHFCQIEDCNSKMFWDKTSISNHLRKHDNMSLQDYASTYMDNYTDSSDESINKSKSFPSTDISWANRSIYNCVLCDIKIYSRKAFESHIKSKHKLLLGEYTAKHGRTVEHEEKHVCQVEGCSSTFLWDSIAITGHLKLKHDGMLLDTYGTKYMHSYTEKSKKTSPSQDEIFDRCIYKCALCDVELLSKSRLSYHLKSVHSISMNDYNKEYGRNMSHEEKHSCQVDSCNAFMWWDRTYIGNHLRSSHDGLPLEEYESKYMINYKEKPEMKKEDSPSSLASADYSWANRCIFKCALCSITLDSRRKFEGHVKVKHEMLMGDYATQYGRTMEHEEKHTCQVEECSSTFLWDSVAIVGHLKLKHDSLPLHVYENKYMSTYTDKVKTKKEKERGYNLETFTWANKCVFKCTLCGNEMGSRSRFIYHIKSHHSLHVRDYLKEHGKSIMHEENHSCQIESCHTFVLWDKQFLYDHLYDKHDKMSLEEYERTYMANYVEKVKIKTEKGLSSSLSHDFSWANRCTFKCAICESTFDSRRKFEGHIKSKHEMLVGDYTIQYGKCIEYEEKHSCQVNECDSTFQWDVARIIYHLKLKHENLSLEDYGDKYMSGYTDNVKIKKEKGSSSFPSQDFSWANKCIFKCVLCDITLDSRRKFEGHVKGKHEMLMGDYATQYGRTIEYEEKHTCQVEECNSTFLWDSVAILGHLKLKHDSLPLQDYEKNYMATYRDKSEKSKTPIPSGYNVSWANRCIFKCIICDTTKKSRKKFEKHIKLMHQKNLTEYQKVHGKTMAIDKKHTCQIENCGSTFTWDATSFVYHFRLKHEKMTLQEYEQTFMPNYKEKSDQRAVDVDEQSSEINQCTYLCQICEQKFNSENGFKSHLKKDHTVGLDSYKRDFGLGIDTKVLHTCQLCQENTELFWNSNGLFLHAKEVHQLPAEKYLQEHIKSWTVSDKEDIPEEEKWMFKCLLGCKECKLSFKKKEHLQKHLEDVHESQGIADDLELNFIRKEFHKCLICKTKTEIIADKMNIENHLRTNHVISLSTYHKYLAAQPQKQQQDDDWMNKCLFKCIVEGCGSIFNTSLLLGKHFMEVHKDGKIYDMKQSPVLKMVRHICQICTEDLMWEYAYLEPHFKTHNVAPEEYKQKYMPSYQFNEIFLVPVQKTTEEESEEILTWTAGTLYLCNICNQEVAGLYQFEKHLKSLHQTDFKQYERNHTDFVKFPGFHICKVCQKNVKHDRKPLKNHMKEHNMSITEYFNKYQPRMPKLYKHMKNKNNKN